MRQRFYARSMCDRFPPSLGLLGCLLVVLPFMGGCGAQLERTQRGYYFNHTLLNESWRAPYFQRTTPVPDSSRKGGPRVAGSGKSTKTAGPSLEASPSQWLRGSDEGVVRAEMVAAAARLVGLRNSFDSDSFLRHVLVVNNLLPHTSSNEGLVARLYKPGTAKLTPKPGDILFLGEGTPDMAVVVEQVESDGTVTFIGVIGDEVGRGLLNPLQPAVRRDEASGRTLNTYLKGNRLAGQSLLAVYSLSGASQPAK